MEEIAIKKLRNKITLLVSGLIILTSSYSSNVSESCAGEKTKTEKVSASSKIPQWLNLYIDMGYVNGNNYQLIKEMLHQFGGKTILDVKGRNIYNTSIGATILYNSKNIPIFMNLDISNLYDITKNSNSISELRTNFDHGYDIITGKNESYPFISLSLGSFKKYSNYAFNTAFTYSTNIKRKNESVLENYIFSITAAKYLKNFSITLSNGYLKKISKYSRYFENVKIYENIINLEFIISYHFKYIAPYISYYQEIYKTELGEIPSYYIRDRSKRTGIIFKTGIFISTSKILKCLKVNSGSLFHQSIVTKNTLIRDIILH